MIFGIVIHAMTSVFATTISPLLASISSADDQFVASAGRVVLLGTPNMDSYSGSWIPSSMVAERKSRIEGDEFVSYTMSDDATVDILSLI